MTLLLDWLFAFLPILAVLVLMLRFRWDGARAGAVGWVTALVVGALRFGAGWQVLAYAQLKALLLALYVLYIIWGALLFYCVTDEAGAVETLGAGLVRLTPDRGLQALLLGWVFSAFLQGVGGFGVPVAVIAPLLMGLGFPSLAAVVIPSVGHPWAVGLGSLGASMTAMVAATGRSAQEIAPWSAVMMGLTCLGCGAATLWAAGGWRTLRAGLVPLFVVGPVMAGALYFVATHQMDVLGSMMAGLVGLAVGVAWAWWRARDTKQDAGSRRQDARSRRQEARSRRQEARSRRQEARSRRQEARSRRQEARSKKQEAGSRGREAGGKDAARVGAHPLCAPGRHYSFGGVDRAGEAVLERPRGHRRRVPRTGHRARLGHAGR